MKREILSNGSIRLTSEYGIIDTRTENVYSVVVTTEKKERYFVENTEDQQL